MLKKKQWRRVVTSYIAGLIHSLSLSQSCQWTTVACKHKCTHKLNCAYRCKYLLWYKYEIWFDFFNYIHFMSFLHTNVNTCIQTCIHACIHSHPVSQTAWEKPGTAACSCSFTNNNDCCCSAARVMSLPGGAVNKQPSCFCLRRLRYFCMACSRGSKGLAKTGGDSPASSAETEDSGS